MHIHELNPWRTLIALSVFILVLVVGFLTMRRPMLTYQLDMRESLEELNDKEACFYPWELEQFFNDEKGNIVLFDIRDNFVFGQGHIPGAENISANKLTQKENLQRLEKLNEMGVTVVIYGQDQLEANGPWMLFKQVGLNNVKVLLGGYKFYVQHKDDLTSSKTDSTYQKGIPRYNYANMANPDGGAALNSRSEKKPVIVRRSKKTNVAAGGC